MTITEFIEMLKRHQSEIGCDGEGISSHSGLKSSVSFVLTNPELDFALELDESEYKHGIENSLIAGCLCPDGIIIQLKAMPE